MPPLRLLWVGSASSAVRTADVTGASNADQGHQALGDRFGDCSRSSGCRPMAAALSNRSLTRLLLGRSYVWKWPRPLRSSALTPSTQAHRKMLPPRPSKVDRSMSYRTGSSSRLPGALNACAILSILVGCRSAASRFTSRGRPFISRARSGRPGALRHPRVIADLPVGCEPPTHDPIHHHHPSIVTPARPLACPCTPHTTTGWRP